MAFPAATINPVMDVDDIESDELKAKRVIENDVIAAAAKVVVNGQELPLQTILAAFHAKMMIELENFRKELMTSNQVKEMDIMKTKKRLEEEREAMIKAREEFKAKQAELSAPGGNKKPEGPQVKVNSITSSSTPTPPTESRKREIENSEVEEIDQNGFTLVQNRKRSANKSFSNLLSNAVLGSAKNSYLKNIASHKNAIQQTATGEVSAPRAPKIKPIFVYSPETVKEKFELLGKIQENLAEKCHATPNGEMIKLHPVSHENHRQITTTLDSLKVQYFIIPERINPPVKVVIRGLPKDTPADMIEKELTSKNFLVQKVVQMVSYRTKEAMPLFQVQLTDSESTKEIFDLTNLLYYRISVEVYRNPVRVTQCFRCQRFHHKQDSCAMVPRCVRCLEQHGTRECPLGEGKIDSPKCVNCHGNHAASYRGCSKFPVPFNSNRTTPGRSFAAAAAGANQGERRETTVTNSRGAGNTPLAATLSEFAHLIVNLTEQLNKFSIDNGGDALL